MLLIWALHLSTVRPVIDIAVNIQNLTTEIFHKKKTANAAGAETLLRIFVSIQHSLDNASLLGSIFLLFAIY